MHKLDEWATMHESEPHKYRAVLLGDVNVAPGRAASSRADRMLMTALRRWVEAPAGCPTHISPSTKSVSEIDRCWMLMPRSLVATARPHSHVGAQPEWMFGQGLSDHSPIIIEWPQRRGLQRENRPIPREVAEDAGMPRLLEAMYDYAKMETAPELAEAKNRWKQHKMLIKEAACVIRDRQMVSGGSAACSVASDSRRTLTLARALWAGDNRTLRALRRHWPLFETFVQETSHGYELADPAAFESQLRTCMARIMAERIAESSRESKRGSKSKRSQARVARTGAVRAAALWRSKAPSVQLTGVRVVDPDNSDEMRVVIDGGEMSDAVRAHWLPIFQAAGADSPELREEVKQWATRWNFTQLTPPDAECMQRQLQRSRRTAPGPDGVPYAMWKAAGLGGARTLCMLLAAFADGEEPPADFNAAWLALLPKGAEDEDSEENMVRTAGNLRPLLLKNTDSKAIAAALARGMRKLQAAHVHATQRGFIAGREMSRNVLELDTYARAMHSTIPGGDLPVLLLCDMATAFPSVNRHWLAASMEEVGMPRGAIRVVRAVYKDMELWTRLGGCQKMGKVTSGIPQGCPLSGALFVLAADPLGRRLHAELRKGKAGMVRQGADDTAVLVRSIRLLSVVEPAFRAAEHYAGVKLKPEKCEVIMVGSRRDEAAKQEIQEALRTISASWADFQIKEFGKYLGHYIGPEAGNISWQQPLAKWATRTHELALRGVPAEAAAALYRQRAVSVLSYVGTLTTAPPRIAEQERHLVGRLLHLPGGALPQRGHLELAARWGWPRVGSVEANLAVETRNRAERTRAQWTPLVSILDGAWVERPLSHLADGVRHDSRWQGVPAAMHLLASVSGDRDATDAMQAVAAVPEDEWVKMGRAEKEQLVAEKLRPNWVERAITKRMQKVLRSSEEHEARGMDEIQIERIRSLVCQLTPAWAVTACRMFLNLWTTSHRMHDESRDACYWGCEAVDSLGHYLTCAPLRMIVSMFDEDSTPHDSVAAFFGVGAADECPCARGAVRRAVLAGHVYHTVRAARRETGIMEADRVDNLARRAAVEIAEQVSLFWARRGRHPPPPRAPRPEANDAQPAGSAVPVGPLRVGEG